MRNALLIAKREYLERVRTKSFIISTVLLPAFMIGMMVLPSKLAIMKSGTRHIAVVCANADFAQAVRAELQSGKSDELRNTARYEVDIVGTPDAATRDRLRAKVDDGQLDGYVWLDEESLRSRKISYAARETSDFIEMARVRAALKTSLLRQALLQRGVSAESADALTKDVDLQATGIKQGKEKHALSGPTSFLAAIVLVMMLYISLLLYGVSVMRAVLEEKSSRVVEVLLSSATAMQLMAGKVVGVGAAGLTQIGVWVTVAGTLPAIGMLAARGASLKSLDLSPAAVISFGVFFALGYALYSALYAALGAMVNSEQEAQQWQFFVMMPIIVPIMLMTFVLRQPNAPISVWLSMVPFFTPILMYMRIIVAMPPWWQLALSVVLMLFTIWGTVALCSRIYRVGILMYGKKPTVPEIMKWIRYA